MWFGIIDDRLLKRIFDVVVSLILLAVTLPLYPLVALAIKLDSSGTVFYSQVRVGLRGRLFRIIKFRTMVASGVCQSALTVKGDLRITQVGAWLRRVKADEFPTFLNVLKGDMSIVGPRPELPQFVQNYNAVQSRILEIRPGITDLGTLQFNNETNLVTDPDHFEEFYLAHILPQKLALNLAYIKRQSFFLDLRIIVETLFLMVRQTKD